MSPRGIEIKTAGQLRLMRKAGLVVAAAHAAVRDAAHPGVTTGELDAVSADVLARHGAASSFLRYGAGFGLPPYPGVSCISVNNEIVHGIPGQRVLQPGDMVSFDFGAIVSGWHGDAAITFGVGPLSADRQALSDVTRESLWAGIAAAKLGGRVTDISHAVEKSVRSHAHPYGIVAEYTGHGIGSAMHQMPDVPNYGRAGRGPKIVEGLCLAIEPMVTTGSPESAVLADEWTVVTTDGSDAAHWEHTITVTKGGLWVLTAPDGGEEMCSKLGLRFGPLAD